MVRGTAYVRVYHVMESLGRDWAVTEHMNFNGSDFVRYSVERLQQILVNTLQQGTRFGWEFVNVANSTSDPFSMYHDDWSPKRVMKVVDGNWDYWVDRLERIESEPGS